MQSDTASGKKLTTLLARAVRPAV